MQASKAAIDPLWQCLCPSWSQSSLTRASHLLKRPRKSATPCLNSRRTGGLRRNYQTGLDTGAQQQNETSFQPFSGSTLSTTPIPNPIDTPRKQRATGRTNQSGRLDLSEIIASIQHEETSLLYGRLQTGAVYCRVPYCRALVEYLVKERREKPNLQMYNALILSNCNNATGAAWRVADLLEEMGREGLQPDSSTCHAVLKVLSVHVDHLLRNDILEYMRERWYQLTEDGSHDVAAGLLREGLFEQALQMMDEMRAKRVDAWLWDMAVYMLCDAGEIEEACRIWRTRYDADEQLLSKNIWAYLLDKGSQARHHEATALVWTTQVNPGFLNPSSGQCLNILATAAQAGDAVMATEVFGHLSKRGTAFQPVHYELLISTYLNADPPDLKRAISILTIMPLEKMEPTIAETRAIFLYLRDKPELVQEAFAQLRELHSQDRKIPIAALNLLIECYVDQRNLSEAMKVYKLIHTFAPISQGPQKSFANIDTFNLLLKGCRLSDPPDDQQASFLVSELLALRTVPTSLTYDRLMLVFVEAAKAALRSSSDAEEPSKKGSERARGLELLDWAFRHLTDMQPLDWMPRFGTLEQLAVALANVGDERCWDVIQAAEDQSDQIEGFESKGKWVRKNVNTAWEAAVGVRPESADGEPEAVASA